MTARQAKPGFRRPLMSTLLTGIRRTWWRSTVALLLAGLLTLVVVVLAASGLTHVFAGQGGIPTTTDALLASVGVAFVPALILIALLIVATANALVIMANDAVLGRDVRLGQALVRAMLRVPAVTATLLVVVATVLGLLVATPFIVVSALVLLALTPIARRVRRRRAGFRWPTVRALLVAAIPFAAALLVGARWVLAPVVAAVDPVSPGTALRRSTESSSGRTARVGVIGIGTLVGSIALQQGISWAVGEFLSAAAAGYLIGVLQLMLAIAPIMVLVVLYRMAPVTGAGGVSEPVPTVALPSVAAQRTAIAVTVVCALVWTALPVIAPVSPAAAATLSDTSTFDPPAMPAPATPDELAQFANDAVMVPLTVAPQTSPLTAADDGESALRPVTITVVAPPADTVAVLEDALFTVTVASADGTGPVPTGTVELYGTDAPSEAPLDNGVAVVNARFLSETYGGEMVAAYSGDSVYDSDISYTSHRAYELSTALELSTNEAAASLIGEPVTVRATLALTDAADAARFPVGPVALVLYESGTEIATLTTNAAGVAEFSLPADMISAQATLRFTASIGYEQGYAQPSLSAELDHTVALSAGSVAILTPPSTIDAAVPFPIEAQASGDGVVEFVDAADQVLGVGQTDDWGNVSTAITALNAGTNAIRAVFSPYAGLRSISDAVNFEVTPVAAEFSKLSDAGAHRQPGRMDFSALLRDFPSIPMNAGSLVARVAGTAAPVRASVVADRVTLEMPALAAGVHDVALSFEGPSGLIVSPFTVQYTVGGAPVSVTGTVSVVSPKRSGVSLLDSMILVGDSVELSVAVAATDTPTSPSGMVEVSGFPAGPVGLPLDRGTVLVPIGALNAGSHTLTMSYLGDTLHAAGSETITFEVRGATTTLTIAQPSATAPAPIIGGSILYELVVGRLVSAPLSGDIVALVNGVEVARGAIDVTGQLALLVPFAEIGRSEVTFHYLGNNDLAPSTAERTVTVVGVNAGLHVTYSPNPAHKTGSVTATITTDHTLTPMPTGTVIVLGTDGPIGEPVPLENGAAALTVPVAAVGSDLTVRYSGDARYADAVASTPLVSIATPVTAVVNAPASTGYGDALRVSIAVTSIDAADGVVADGEVTLVDARGYPEVTLGSGPVTDGVATITVPRGSLLTGGIAQLRADYTSAAGLYSTAVSDLAPVTVDPGASRVTALNVSGALSADLRIDATVNGAGATPTGSVDFVFGDRTERAVLVNGRAFIRSLDHGVGEHQYTLHYSGDSNYAPSVSSPVTITVTGYPITLTFEPSTAVTSGLQSSGQVSVRLGARPHGSTVPPETSLQGRVEIWAGGARIADVLVDGFATGRWDNVVTYTLRSSHNGANGTQPVEARYVPRNDKHAHPTVSAEVAVAALRTQIDARITPDRARPGQPVEVRAYAYAPGLDGTETRATGEIAVFDGDTEVCRFAASGSSCVVTPSRSGEVSYTVTYDAHGDFAAAAREVRVLVTEAELKLNPTLSNYSPVTDAAVTVRWDVTNRTDIERPSGRVSAELTNALGRCEADYSAGSCQLPLDRVTRDLPNGTQVTVNYAGDAWWQAVTEQVQVFPVVCHPLGLGANPAQAGVLTATPAPNCASGTGMTHGTRVHLSAQANEVPRGEQGWREADISEGGTVLGTMDVWITMDRPYTLRADFKPWADCVAVDVYAEVSASADSHSQLGDGRAQPVTRPNCAPDGGNPRPWASTGEKFSGHMIVGTDLQVQTTLTRGPYRTDPVVYGYLVNDTFVDTAATTFTTTIDEATEIRALKGAQCFSFQMTQTGAPGEAVLLTQPDCVREPGKHQAGGEIKIRVEPEGIGYLRSALTSDGIDAKHQPVTTITPTSQPSNDEVIVVPVVRDETVEVRIGTCHTLNFVYPGEEYPIETARSDCPSAADPTKKLYKEDTEVRVSLPRAHFTQNNERIYPGRVVWDDGTIGNLQQPTQANETFRMVTMDADRTIEVGFYREGQCGAFSANSKPRGIGLISIDGADNERVCPPIWGGGVPAESHNGMITHLTPMALSAQAKQGDPLVVWQLIRQNPQGTFFFESPKIEGEMVQGDKWTASFCQRVTVSSSFQSQYGVPIEEGTLPNQDEMFVAASPAPNCPGATDAWLVGTEVTFGALADPDVFTFTKWAGLSESDTLLHTVVLDGATPERELTAFYNVQCTTVAVVGSNQDNESETDKVITSTVTESNCPRTDDRGWPAFVNKTQVMVTAQVLKPTMHDGWKGMTSLLGDQMAVVNVFEAYDPSGNMHVTYNFHKQTAGEFFSDVGDFLAESARKVVGVISVFMEQFARYIFPMGIVNMVAGIISLVNDGLKALGVNTGDFGKVVDTITESIDFLSAGYSCIAAWAFSDGADKPLSTINWNGSGKFAHDGAALATSTAAKTLASTSTKVLGSKSVGSLVNSVKGSFSKVSSVVKPIGKVAGIVGGVIGTAQSLVGNIEHMGWSSTGAKAWTTGWESVARCVVDKAPGKAWK